MCTKHLAKGCFVIVNNKGGVHSMYTLVYSSTPIFTPLRKLLIHHTQMFARHATTVTKSELVTTTNTTRVLRCCYELR